MRHPLPLSASGACFIAGARPFRIGTYDALMAAQSMGQFYNQNIKVAIDWLRAAPRGSHSRLLWFSNFCPANNPPIVLTQTSIMSASFFTRNSAKGR